MIQEQKGFENYNMDQTECHREPNESGEQEEEGGSGGAGGQDQAEEENPEEIFDDEDLQFSPQEFAALSNQMDELQNALDGLESRNASIHSQLLALLQSNREIREQVQSQDQETIDQVMSALNVSGEIPASSSANSTDSKNEENISSRIDLSDTFQQSKSPENIP